MAVLLANNVSSTLAAAISSTDTVLSVATGTGSGFPIVTTGDHFYATLVSTAGLVEIVKVTARTNDALTVTRGQDGTTAIAFALGSRVEMRINAASVADYVANFNLETRYLGPSSSDPTTRVDGSALQTGDLYFNTTSNELRVYNGSAWINFSVGVRTEEFIAIADQTVFTATQNTYNPGTNDLAVYVNGVRQFSGAYTETSTTIVTFAEGLIVGDLVQLVFADTNTTVASSSDFITYTQGGTGATDRTLTSVLQERVSVKDFGAVGDGVTDDTAAIQAAAIAASASNQTLTSNDDHVLGSAAPALGNVPRTGNGRIIQDGFTYPWATQSKVFSERFNYHSDNFSGSGWEELIPQGGDYHSFGHIAQNDKGVLLASWMHQTQHGGSSAADVVCQRSDDGGATWSNTQIVYGTLNGSDAINPFYQVLGVDRDGRFTIIFNKYASNPGVAPSKPWITRSYDGFNWSAAQAITFSGDSITESSTIVPFGEIKLLPSGKLALAIHQGNPTDSHYIAVIDDDVSEVGMEMRLIASIGDYTATTISFDTSDDSINDTANGLGFLNVGERFNTTSTSTTNDRACTVVSVTASKVVIEENVTTESAATAGTVNVLLDYNETVFLPLTETIWFAFLRQADVTNQIPYYTSADAGETWTWRGHIGAGLSGGWIPQAAERVTIDDTPHILLAVGLRDSATDPAGYLTSALQYFICPAKEAIDNSGQWHNIHQLALAEDAYDRDLYSGQVVNDMTGELLAITHEETATDESRILTQRFSYREKASNTIDYVDVTLEGTGGTANTYSGNPRVYYVKRGRIVFIYGSVVLAAKNTTGPLTLAGLPFTCDSGNDVVIPCAYYNTTATENHISMRSVSGTKTFQLIEGNVNSNVDSSEVNSDFNLRFSGVYFTDD